jgi:hypothetical protein
VKKISEERGKAVKQEQVEKKEGTFMSEEKGERRAGAPSSSSIHDSSLILNS